jgi:hypothetical protein
MAHSGLGSPPSLRHSPKASTRVRCSAVITWSPLTRHRKPRLNICTQQIEVLVHHHRRFGYRNFVIEHIWRTEWELADLKLRLDDMEFHCFLLILPIEENLRRIERRQTARAIDEREFEYLTLPQERRALEKSGLGTPFDVSASPPELVLRMLALVGQS